MRSARVQAAAARAVQPGTEIPAPEGVSQPQRWKRYLKLGACCGLPLLALLLLATGTAAVLGAAAGLVPILAALACPLGMYFMMRAMSKTAHPDQSDAADREKQLRGP